MNKVHLYIFGVHLALFLLKKISLGMAAIYLHSNNTAVEEKKAQITRFLNSTLNNRLSPPKKARKLVNGMCLSV